MFLLCFHKILSLFTKTRLMLLVLKIMHLNFKLLLVTFGYYFFGIQPINTDC